MVDMITSRRTEAVLPETAPEAVVATFDAEVP